jgi:transcriptional regulatory protein LevR
MFGGIILNDNITMRLDILLKGNAIDRETLRMALKIDDLLKSYDTIYRNNEQYEMFITHIAMMIQRVKNNNYVNEVMDDDIYDEIKKCLSYKEAVDILEKIEGVSNTILPESERRFIILHLCNLLERGCNK